MDAELETAIKEGNVNLAKKCVDRGADTERGRPLILCIQKGELEIAKFLIEIGANTTKPCPKKTTPLSWAISEGNLDMVKLLLDNGAEFTMYQGLIDAIEANNLEIVSELIKHGVDVRSSDYAVSRLVMCATLKKIKYDARILKLLVENGANLQVVERSRYLLLATSIQHMNVPLIEYLIQNIPDLDLNSYGNQSELPIMDAVHNKNVDSLKLLVEHGANVNLVNSKGDTPLIKSVRNTNISAIKYLIANKADLDVKNTANETALSVALSNVDFRSAKLLIESGADPKLATKEIEALKKEYRDFAAYMSKLEQTKTSNGQQLEDFAGHDAASQ